MAPKRKVLAASCVMLFIGPLFAAFQCCGLLFQCRGLLFQCCGLLLALRNVFLALVQHNSFSTCSADQEHLFCFFDVDKDAPEFCFLFDFVIETSHSQRSRPKAKLRYMPLLPYL